jgi:hypothetical protein
MISKETARRIHLNAIHAQHAQRLFPVVIPPPRNIKKPKQWVVLEDSAVTTNGSYTRLARGYIVDTLIEANLLREAGVPLQAVA